MVARTISTSCLSDPVWRRLVRLLGMRQFGEGAGGDWVDWAVDALVAGRESHSLNMLAGLTKPPNEFEVDRYIKLVLDELRVEVPGAALLARLYAVAIAEDMLAGDIAPYDGARALRRLWLDTGCGRELQPWDTAEDRYELAHDGVYGDVAEVERDILEEARRMVSRD